MMRAALPQPDFLRPTRRAGGLAWAWCATGLLVLAATALEAVDAWQLHQQTRERLALAERPRPAAPAGATATTTAGPAPSGMPAADAAQRALDAQAARWLQRLALPWPAVFGAAETAAVDGTQFTGLAFDGLQGLLRLEGQSAQPAPALAAAEALRAGSAGDGSTGAVWHPVTLARLDSASDGRRFEIVARLAPGAAR